MNSDPPTLLWFYASAIVAASLLGGWLPAWVRMTHTRTQLVMSFVAGLMLGVAVYHLLPHSLLQLEAASPGSGSTGPAVAIDRAAWWIMLGMVVMLLLLRLFHFHKHEHSPGAHPLSWLGMALGLGLHTLIDGVALGAALRSDVGHTGAPGLVGFGVFLAIALHKPLDALSITSMMQAGGWSRRARSLANIGFACLCPLGALLFFRGVGQLPSADLLIGCALAFSAGVFFCISLGDLLPEVHFHSHDRLKLTASFLLGIGLAYGLRYLEPGMLHTVQ